MSDFKGEVVFITPTTSVSDKFKKREVTLKSDGEYPQYVLIEQLNLKLSIPKSIIEICLKS